MITGHDKYLHAIYIFWRQPLVSLGCEFCRIKGQFHTPVSRRKIVKSLFYLIMIFLGLAGSNIVSLHNFLAAMQSHRLLLANGPHRQMHLLDFRQCQESQSIDCLIC